MNKPTNHNKLPKINIKSSPDQVLYLKTGGIIVIGILVVCFVFFMAKGLFSNNDNELPAGIYTGTINTGKTVTELSESEIVADSKDDNSDSQKTEESSSETDESSVAESTETVFVNQYAYLHTEPDKDAENIVCMSPGIEINVLEKLENGYWKVTFMNIDGQKTGYVWNEYVQSEPVAWNYES